MAAGIERVEDLARVTASDEQTLWDLLSHLAARGVFDEPDPGRFVMNEAGQQLRDRSLHLYLDLERIGGRFAHAWGSLLTFVRTGHSGYKEMFGTSFWEDLAAHPDIAVAFDELMGAAHSGPDQSPPMSHSWSTVRTVVDVGGGLGHVLAEILHAHQHLRGVLVDLPQTADRATNTLKEGGLAERVQIVGQSFFDPLPARGDVYLLRGILNDWPDDDKERILLRCAEACHDGSCVLIWGGGVRREQSQRAMQIDKVLCGSRDMTLNEFQTLAARCGLEIAAIHEPRFVIECQPTRSPRPVPAADSP